MTDRRAVVTGLGVVSPVGIGAEATWDALVAGRSGIDRITLFDTSPFEVDVAGEVKGFEATNYMDAKDARRHDRSTHFAVAATGEALRDAGLLGDDGHVDPRRRRRPLRHGLRHRHRRHRPPARRPQDAPRARAAPGEPVHAAAHAPRLARRGRSRSSSASAGRTWRSSAPARPAATPSARRWRRSCAARRTSCSAPAPRRRCCRSPSPASARCARSARRSTPTPASTTPAMASRPFDATRNGFVVSEGSAVLVLEELAARAARAARGRSPRSSATGRRRMRTTWRRRRSAARATSARCARR